MGDGDARHRGAPDVVVGDQKPGRDAAEDADLVTDPHEIGGGRRFDLADQLEAPLLHAGRQYPPRWDASRAVRTRRGRPFDGIVPG
jgi:hypothetical protein